MAAHSCEHHHPSSSGTASGGATAEADTEMVAFFEASIPDAKELQATLGTAGIEVLLTKRGGCGTGCGCGSKVVLMAHRDDLPRVASVFDQRWRALVKAEGTLDVDDDEGQPRAASATTGTDACPACGTAVSDLASACTDCGLVWG